MIFAGILIGFELIIHYASIAMHGEFVYSPLVPIVLLVMMRWGWQSVFYAVGDGLLYCLLNGLGWESYLCYCIGNAAIMILLLALKLIGKEKIASKWYLSAILVIAGWLITGFAKTLLFMCFGIAFLAALWVNITGVSCWVSLVIGLLIILVVRKLDGMFEDQKHYLIRKDKERKEMMRRDTYGDEPIDIDEETLSALRKWDDDM